MAANKTNTTLNLPFNVLTAACYLPWLGWVVAILVLPLEKGQEARWHAVHGFLISLTFFLLSMVLLPLAMLFMVAGLVVQLYAAVKVYNGEKPRFWMVSDWADKAAEKIKM